MTNSHLKGKVHQTEMLVQDNDGEILEGSKAAYGNGETASPVFLVDMYRRIILDSAERKGVLLEEGVFAVYVGNGFKFSRFTEVKRLET